jgi:(2Fe-2S) ferredoxin
MQAEAVPFQRMVFVCINRREGGEPCCAPRGGEAIAVAIKARIKALGLAGRVRVSKSGCLDVCAQGPNVMVFPDGRWYKQVTEADVERIVQDLAQGLAASES